MNRLQNITIGIIAMSILGGASFAFALTPAVVPTIQERYKKGEMIKVLVVPGHDNQFSGAAFKKDREADMTLVVAKKLEKYLGQDPQLVAVVARNDDDYIKDIRNYFENETSVVNDFIKSRSAAMKKEIASGSIVIPKQVPHGNAAKIPLYRLYALNKWATEEKFDLVIHIHFNDEGGRILDRPGKFSGYSVYVPDTNLLGAPVSKDLGMAIAKRLKRYFDPSNMSYEYNRSDRYGVISDIKLIALGANKTIAIPRILIEYAYVYESFVASERFELSSDMMAAITAQGVNDFLLNMDK